jgi:hypothetical protein
MFSSRDLLRLEFMFKTLGLFDADRHRSLVERRFLAHPLPQVDGLKATAVLFTKLTQLREHLPLQGVAFFLKSLNVEPTKTRKVREDWTISFI